MVDFARQRFPLAFQLTDDIGVVAAIGEDLTDFFQRKLERRSATITLAISRFRSSYGGNWFANRPTRARAGLARGRSAACEPGCR